MDRRTRLRVDAPTYPVACKNSLGTNAMFDLLMLALLAAAFAGAVGYVWACVDLTKPCKATGDKSP